ncbi:MAG: hypothetical protein FWE86_04330, partial [Oscillospiraceae bacterium]|nr:hypothetical protein [Oscillospiraceae bacterium]
MRALKYLKDHLLSLLLIAALLVAQAWCDLSLPGYTQKIVDVGISQGGVETACPDTLRPEAMRAIKLFLPDGEAFYYDDLCFYKESDGLYHYCGNKLISNTNHDDREKIAELTGQSVFNLLQFVMARMNSAGGGGAMDMSGMAGGDLPQIDIASPELTAMLDAIEVMLESGVMTKQELLETQSPLDDMSDEMQAMARDKIGVAFVRSEYAAQGIDMQKYQTDYMWRVGGMMLAL